MAFRRTSSRRTGSRRTGVPGSPRKVLRRRAGGKNAAPSSAYLGFMKDMLSKLKALPKQTRFQQAHQIWREQGHTKHRQVKEKRVRKQPQRKSAEEIANAREKNLEKAREEKAKLRAEKHGPRFEHLKWFICQGINASV